MAVRQKQNKKIYIETDYDNIVVVNPNEVFTSSGEREERLVDHEDLVYYANLETFIIPRTKLAIGQTFTDPVVNTTIATKFAGDDALKVNFLKPKGKSEFDTSWSNQITGEGSRNKNATNQTVERTVNFEGKKVFERGVSNYEDTQLLGIKRITVAIKGTGVPEVNIELVDIQGRSLFEQGENSLYSAFFNFPYPLFYLTLKGYYGKAVRYRLSLMTFNASFDSDTGNYNISLKLIGKFTALLFDTPLSYAITAPKMYNTQITVTEPNGNKKFFNTYKGRQKLKEVYDIYKRKGLLPSDFPVLSIEDFIYRVENYKTGLKNDLNKQEDFTKLNDLQDFADTLNKLKTEVFEYAINKYLDRNSYYIVGQEIYYPFQKQISFQSREDFKTKIKDRIQKYVSYLKENASFGEGKSAEYQINITLKDEKDIIKKLNFKDWSDNRENVRNTYQARYNRPLDSNDTQGYEKFIIDESANAVLDTKVLDEDGEWVEDTADYFVFGDKIVSDGTFVKNSYLDKLDGMTTSLEGKQKKIEDKLTKFYAEQQLKQPTKGGGGLGFSPSIRNIFAIIMAGADAFYRLMEDNHQEAWNVRTEKDRLLAVIPAEKNFSVDALRSIQKSSGELNDDNVVYPWPLYFTLEKQASGSDLYTIQYPGDAKFIRQTKAYDYRIWPEVGFTEAFIKASLEKEKPEVNYSYDNPKDVTNYVSCNALEFPFNTAPYQELNAIKTFYEIFERSYLSSHYGNLPTDATTKNQIDKFYGDIESLNISQVAEQDITINQTLRNYKLNMKSLLEYMKKISNDGQGQSWQSYIRNIFTTDYIQTMLKNINEIYSIDTLESTSTQVSADLSLIDKMKQFLNDTQTSAKNSLDTYPFTDKNWLKKNMSNGNGIESYEDYNKTINSYVFLENKKTIARVDAKDKNTNLKLFTSQTVFENENQTSFSNSENPDLIINSQESLKNYFTNRKPKDLYMTESYIDYGTNYSGNVKTSIQTTSLLNTPYFVNSLLTGVKNKKNNKSNPYVAMGYLFLNSLPLITTKEKIKNFTNNVATDLDYLASTFTKFSAIHQVPYAWILKYGSIWHRYKYYVDTKIDILDEVWKDFDYEKAYDPVSGNSFTKYTILDYSGNPQQISLQSYNLIGTLPNVTGSLSIFNTGFYPQVVNAVEYYLNGRDLFTGYTATDFSNAYNKKGFRIGFTPTSASNIANVSSDNNFTQSLIKTNAYVYRISSGTTQSSVKKVIIYPSMGGVPFDQSIYECFNQDNKMVEQLTNNKKMFNGTVRTFWGAPNFGYFDTTLIKKPKPTEYLKVIKQSTDIQNDFDLVNNQSVYSSIEEIFNVFDVDLLNKMEQKFLTFCNPTPSANDLILNNENIKTTYTNTGGLLNANLKLLKSQIESLFTFNALFLQGTNEDKDSNTIIDTQKTSLYSTLNQFLNFDCVLKVGNPTQFDRKLYNSFSNLNSIQNKDKYVFEPYVIGTLPGDNSAVTLLESITQNANAWKALRKYVGFSSINGMDYPIQVDNAFPSVSGVTTPNSQLQPLQLQLVGTYSTQFPLNLGNFDIINVQKTDGTYQVFRIVGEVNVQDIETKLQTISFFQPYSNIEDSSNLVPSNTTNNFSTGNQYISVIQDVSPGEYQMVVTYLPNLVQTTPIKLVAAVSTFPGNQTTSPFITTPITGPQSLPNTQKSFVSDFFIDNNIKFTKENIEILYPLIRLYAELKRNDNKFDKTKFTTYINDFLTDRNNLQDKMVTETFSNLNKILKNIEVDYGLPKTAMNGDATKLSTYNTLKGFNDKWIAGSDLKTNTLFEDFLFMDRANSDLGDSFLLDVDKVVKRLSIDTNQNQSLMSLISGILEDNYFIFMAMPAYINFYGIQEASRNSQPLKDSEIGNSLFGTYLEVDYTKSSPKFLCLYVGNPSEYPKPKENTFNRFGDDSFDLRVPDNPVRRSDEKTNYSLSNKVVGFAVDFGIRNQNIFKNLSLDMSEMKNTSESFQVYADMGSSVAGDKVGQQSQSLYSIYKSRSYTCGVESMGNAMIQPTMYFILRHVPMFYGPYWITEVKHDISERGFNTNFSGTRIPKYALPKIDNLLASVNKDVLSKIKEIAAQDKKPKTAERIAEEKELSTNPSIINLAGEQLKCQDNIPDAYKSIPFEDLSQTTFTTDDIYPQIKQATLDTNMRALVWGIAQIMSSTTLNNSVYNCINNNPFEINTLSNHKGNLNSYIKKQSCVKIGQYSIRLVKFDKLLDSINFMVSYMTEVIKNTEALKTLNPNVDENKSYGEALFQIAYTTWLTSLAFDNGGLDANGIKTTTLNNFTGENGNYSKQTYDIYVSKFTDAYEYFKQNPS